MRRLDAGERRQRRAVSVPPPAIARFAASLAASVSFSRGGCERVIARRAAAVSLRWTVRLPARVSFAFAVPIVGV
jgi:hypothetical protein